MATSTLQLLKQDKPVGMSQQTARWHQKSFCRKSMMEKLTSGVWELSYLRYLKAILLFRVSTAMVYTGWGCCKARAGGGGYLRSVLGPLPDQPCHCSASTAPPGACQARAVRGLCRQLLVCVISHLQVAPRLFSTGEILQQQDACSATCMLHEPSNAAVSSL